MCVCVLGLKIFRWMTGFAGAGRGANCDAVKGVTTITATEKRDKLKMGENEFQKKKKIKFYTKEELNETFYML